MPRVRDRPVIGPLLVLVGAAGFLVVSLMTWYEVDLARIRGGAGFAAEFARQSGLAVSANAWEPWGVGTDLVYAAAIAGGLAIALLGLARGVSAMGPAVGAMVIGALASAVVALHLLSEPEPREIVSVQPVGWLGLLACLLILAGGWLWWDGLHHRAAH